MKILRTASLGSNFTGSCIKKKCILQIQHVNLFPKNLNGFKVNNKNNIQ